MATRSQGRPDQPVEVLVEEVPLDQAQPIDVREPGREVGVQPLVELDRGDPRAGSQERRGEDADARADLEHGALRARPGGLDDGLQHLTIHEVVLAEPLPRTQPVTAQVALDDLRPQVGRVELLEGAAALTGRRHGAGHVAPAVATLAASFHDGRASRSRSARVPARKR